MPPLSLGSVCGLVITIRAFPAVTKRVVGMCGRAINVIVITAPSVDAK